MRTTVRPLWRLSHGNCWAAARWPSQESAQTPLTISGCFGSGCNSRTTTTRGSSSWTTDGRRLRRRRFSRRCVDGLVKTLPCTHPTTHPPTATTNPTVMPHGNQLPSTDPQDALRRATMLAGSLGARYAPINANADLITAALEHKKGVGRSMSDSLVKGRSSEMSASAEEADCSRVSARFCPLTARRGS